MLTFQSITPENEPFVSAIFAGDEAQYWVHYNAYWLESSRRLSDVHARLIYAVGVAGPVGFIAYGQHYQDEDLTQPLPGVLEVIHMVIDKPHQRRGYGREATLWAVGELRAVQGCRSVVIAYHPANIPARHLYESLGFVGFGRNYDGDPLLRLPE